MIILKNLRTNQRKKIGESKYDRKMTKLDVVTTETGTVHVNEVSDPVHTGPDPCGLDI